MATPVTITATAGNISALATVTAQTGSFALTGSLGKMFW